MDRCWRLDGLQCERCLSGNVQPQLPRSEWNFRGAIATSQWQQCIGHRKCRRHWWMADMDDTGCNGYLICRNANLAIACCIRWIQPQLGAVQYKFNTADRYQLQN